MNIDQALALAEGIVNSVRPHCARAEIAGSIRRRKPDVKDVEIVAQVSDWQGLFSALSAWGHFIKPGCPDIIPWPPKEGARYLRMMLHGGVKLDFFITSPENWGGIFMMRTGSGVGPDGNPMKGFVPGMFGRWKKVSGGGKMSEGYPTLPDGRRLAVREEEDFFRICGVELIPATERVSKSAVKALDDYRLDVESLEII
jgi:DNA polymerase/3'-5' exonuclease PolX